MHRILWGAALAVALVGGCAKDDASPARARGETQTVAADGHWRFPAGSQPTRRLTPMTAPMHFEENVGQADTQARFVSRGAGYTLLLTQKEAVFSLAPGCARGTCRGSVPAVDVVRMGFADANPRPAIEGANPLPSHSHYLLGNDPAHWHRNVPHYAKVRYRGVYPGVDVVFYGANGSLEYDFVAEPGAKIEHIGLDLHGVRSSRLSPTGDLVLATAHGELVQHKPIAYQEKAGQRIAVESRYVLRSGTRVGFALGRHDPDVAVVIDPMLGYGTFLGGANGDDRAESIAIDAAGNAYVAGFTNSGDFPLKNALQSTPAPYAGVAFVSKYDGDGKLIFDTYLGGTGGDFATGVAVDADGAVLVAGRTHSEDFPMVAAAQPAYGGNGDTFVAKLTADGGSLVYSTYLGGTESEDMEPEMLQNDPSEDGETVAVDAAGNAYVTGGTWSTDFPTQGALQAAKRAGADAFVTKFDPDGAIVYSTYLGSNQSDYGHAIAVSPDGHAYVAGSTMGPDFPTVLAFQSALGGDLYPQDGFIAKLSIDGASLDYSSYLGGSNYDRILAIAIGPDGSAYVTGHTFSGDFPTVGPLQPCYQYDAFVTKIAPAGDSLVYSTCLGGSGYSSPGGNDDIGYGIAVDSSGRAIVGGLATSGDFPVLHPMQPALHLGPNYYPNDWDGFVSVLSADGSALESSTYFGGEGEDMVRSVAVDAGGRIYVAGNTTSTDLPTFAAEQPKYSDEYSGIGADDAFVARIDPGIGLTVDDVSIGEGDDGQVQATFTVHLSSPADSAVSFDVATADGTATAGSDYVPLAMTGQTLAPGETEKTFVVEVNGDGLSEAAETFSLELSNVAGAVLADGEGVATIRNDDVALTVGNVSVLEGEDGLTPASFALHLAEPCDEAVTFTLWAVDVTTSGDYQPYNGYTYRFEPGTTDAVVTLQVYGDRDAEPDETFRLMAVNANGSGKGDAEGTGTILNDDPSPLAIADASITEGNSGTKQANFTVSLAQASSAPVTFDVATANGTAAAGSDYTATSLGGVTIPAGSTSVVVSVPVIGDMTIEGNETFQVAVSNVAGATVADGTATGTIVNDDTTLSIADASVVEGDSGTKLANFTVSLAQAVPVPVTFNVATANGGAGAGSDYVATSRTGVTIPAGSRSVVVSVPVIGDTTIELNETFRANVSSVVGATVADGSATGIIYNDDTRLSIADVSIVEGLSGTKPLTFTVKLSNASAVPVTFNAATANKTAVSGSDYYARVLSGLSIPAGSTSKAFTIDVIGDRTVEANEAFLVNVSGVKGAQVADAQAVGTLLNDDAVLSIADAAITEGNSGTKSLAFTVKLSAALPAPVTLGVATANKTAVAGSDYVALALTGQSIPAGATSKVFYVAIKGDILRELNETFLVNVSGVSTSTGTSLTVGDSQALGTIVNDD